MYTKVNFVYLSGECEKVIVSDNAQKPELIVL